MLKSLSYTLHNPYVRDGDFSDDSFTLAGITVGGPGVGNVLRERFNEVVADIFDKYGRRAFEMPKRAAAIHEAGHVVINSVLGIRTTVVFIEHRHNGGQLDWFGFTDSPGLPITMESSPSEILDKARSSFAGIAAEDLFAGDDQREGSSIDEVFMSQAVAEQVALLTNVESKPLWQNDVVAWCMVQLLHNRDIHAAITSALLERKRIKGKRLRELCAKVRAVTSPRRVCQ